MPISEIMFWKRTLHTHIYVLEKQKLEIFPMVPVIIQLGEFNLLTHIPNTCDSGDVK